ncbi:MAG: enoyl-CoA hydratase [Betaproteobacteria bacterium]|nr:enoyl-CoA hydratase [Betaproteobacteria bacterium]
MTEPVLLVEKSEGIATVTLNRPAKMNALTNEMQRLLRQAFRDVQADSAVQVAILTGAGRAFCAGLDLKELSATDGFAGRADNSDREPGDFFFDGNAFQKPLIGAINGVAITGGFELALMCDILIASTEARFADTHARVGILPGAGLSQKLARAIGIYRAKEVSLTGNFISAAQAESWGLVNRVVAPGELLTACRALAKDIMSCLPDVVRGYKRLIDDGFARTYGDGLALENERFEEFARRVKGDAIASVREGVISRGRTQTKS